MQTEVFDRLQVLHGHQAAGGPRFWAVLLHTTQVVHRHVGNIKSVLKSDRAHGEISQCQFSRTGSFIIDIGHEVRQPISIAAEAATLVSYQG